ncbi:hypothetical protein ACKP2L_03495 [Oenococcus alcoholitolerans]|uniref:hypothetical protein n=1 Tax=Oenococcus alcoholitolerans TaxID=931074 RepID=UPI003F72B528
MTEENNFLISEKDFDDLNDNVQVLNDLMFVFGNSTGSNCEFNSFDKDGLKKLLSVLDDYKTIQSVSSSIVMLVRNLADNIETIEKAQYENKANKIS